MKNTKALKLIVLALSLIFIVGMAVGFAASAEEELSVEITKKNISYGEQVQILFAVDNSNAGGKDVEVIYYLEDPQVNPEAKAYDGIVYKTGYTDTMGTEDTADDVTYPAFFTAAFPAKNIGEQIYAQAHIVDTDVYSDVVRYSVVEYLNKRLYVDTISENEKGLYESLLSYGAYAQKVLYNEDDDPYNDKTQFIDEMVYVSIEGGTLDGKYSTGVYYVGDKINPNKEGAMMWNVDYIDADGNAVSDATRNNSSYTITGTSFISLNTNATLPSYYDSLADNLNYKGWNFDNDFTTAQAMHDGSKLRRATADTTYRTADHDAIVQGTNEYVKVTPLADLNNVFEFGTGHGAKEGFFFRRHSYSSAVMKTYKNFVFEANIKLNISDEAAEAILAAGDNYVMSIYLGRAAWYTPEDSNIRSDYYTGKELGRVYVTKDEEGKFHYYFNCVTDKSEDATTTFAELKNGWNNITLETTEDKTNTNCANKVYVNGCKVGESSFDGTTDAALNGVGGDLGVRFRYNSVVTKSYIYLDNVFCSYGQPFN